MLLWSLYTWSLTCLMMIRKEEPGACTVTFHQSVHNNAHSSPHFLSPHFTPCSTQTFFILAPLYHLACFLQICERLPVLQTAMALPADIWGCDLVSSVPRAFTWATLRHVWPWHGAAGRLHCHEAHALARCASCVEHTTQTDKWWDNRDKHCSNIVQR